MNLTGNKKPSKYKNKKIEIDGIIFHSEKEGKRYWHLKLLVRAKEITNLCLQVPFVMTLNNVKICTYRADFTYTDKNGNYIVEDSKGVKTDTYILKKKMMKAFHGIDILET